MARYNKIFAGPTSEVLPQVREAPADVAILPGIFTTITGGETVVALAATRKVYVAQDNYLTLKGVDVAYGVGETVINMELLDEQFFNVRFPTGVNVTQGAAISVGTGGKGKLAAATEFVVAFAEEAYNNTSGADQLVRVRAAKGFVVPA